MNAPAHLQDPWAGKLSLAPITTKAALAYVRRWHRHLPELQGGLFAISCVDPAGEVVAVGVAGNPARVWQGTGRVVISRVAVSVPGNSCGMIYGALCRSAQELGYRDAWSYTLPDEDGRTLRGAGFVDMGLTKDGEWSRPSRTRDAAVRPEQKRRWARILGRRPSLSDIAAAWRADTSYYPQLWSIANPALGQCAITALLVNELRGTVICRNASGGHYWNEADGKRIDLTASQFGGAGPDYGGTVAVDRAELVANIDTRRRYEHLRSRVLGLPAKSDAAERLPAGQETPNSRESK